MSSELLDEAFIEHILSATEGATIGVVGDLFLDRYWDIDTSRTEPSLETGLAAYQIARVRSYPGAAGTIINNLAALGVGRIVPVGFIGDDGEGYEMRQALAKLSAVDPQGILLSAHGRTPTYTKPMFDGVTEWHRLDIKNHMPTPPPVVARLIDTIRRLWRECAVWLVLDQVSEAECGVVTSAVREAVATLATDDPDRFVLADSRTRIGLFRRVAIKPNEREWQQLQSRSDLLRENALTAAFVTRGEAGIDLFRPEESEPLHIAAYPVSGPIDIVGAGDSCSAGIACAVIAGVDLSVAAAFGNLVASITIQQLGTTGTATPTQVRERWAEVQNRRLDDRIN